MSDHRVSVDNGKYTFIFPEKDYRYKILRYGEEWHDLTGVASNAIHSIMCELDAARVVLAEVRCMANAGLAGDTLLDALKRHDSLVGENGESSDWCKP